jgi:hypothetical protein
MASNLPHREQGRQKAAALPRAGKRLEKAVTSGAGQEFRGQYINSGKLVKKTLKRESPLDIGAGKFAADELAQQELLEKMSRGLRGSYPCNPRIRGNAAGKP